MNRAAPLLSIRGLRTEFPTEDGVVAAVDGVDLDVRPGECLGVVGESGSGKSVTFLSVLGLIRPPGRVIAGEVVFDGRMLSGADDAALRAVRGKAIALTFQDAQTALNPSMRVGAQIAEAMDAHLDDLPRGRAARKRALRDRAIAMMRLVRIPAPEKRIGEFPHQFSGGMRQRIMLAIALACRPRLLIADEPTSALDVTVQAQILDLIAEMRRELAMSVVLITHDLGVVAEQCERIVVMYAGQVVEYGTTDAVIAAPRHPYTRGLIDSAPWLGDETREIEPMAGFVPSLIDMPSGCRFAPRCARRITACASAIAMSVDADDHAVRCLRPVATGEGRR